MKSTILLVAGASFVAAQNLTGEPDCAIPCLQNAIASVCTPATDQGCSCANQGPIANAAVSCLLANCDSAGLTQAQAAGAQLCVDYSATAAPQTTGAPTSLPTLSPTGAGSAANATTAQPTTEASSTPTTSPSSRTAETGTAAASSAAATSASAAAAADAVVPRFGAQAGVLGALLAGVVAML
ncbi:unnamed protein product [Discula destructiva]